MTTTTRTKKTVTKAAKPDTDQQVLEVPGQAKAPEPTAAAPAPEPQAPESVPHQSTQTEKSDDFMDYEGNLLQLSVYMGDKFAVDTTKDGRMYALCSGELKRKDYYSLPFRFLFSNGESGDHFDAFMKAFQEGRRFFNITSFCAPYKTRDGRKDQSFIVTDFHAFPVKEKTEPAAQPEPFSEPLAPIGDEDQPF